MDNPRRLFNYRPLVIIALGFTAGIICFGKISGALLLPAASVLSVTTAFMVIKRAYRPAVLAAAILAGILRAQIACPLLPEEGTYDIIGYVAETPVYKNNSWTLIIKSPEISTGPIDGRISLRVYDRGKEYAFVYGDHISVSALIEIPKVKMNTGGIDWKNYYLAKGISATGYVYEVYEVRSNSIDIYGLCLQAREKLAYYIGQIFPNNSQTISGLLLGFTSEMDETSVEAFRISGISHLLSVSGFHIVVIAGFLSLFLRRLGPKIHLLILALFLALYCAVCAFPSSLVRASIMTCISLFASIVQRKNDAANSLSLSCILILLAAPFQIYSLGFILSFCAVTGIALLYKPLIHWFKNLINPLSESLSLSIGATLGTLPVTAYYFNTIPVYSLLSNIVFIPLASAVVVIAFIAVIIAIISLTAAFVVGSVADYLLNALMNAVRKVPLLPFTTINLGSPNLFECMVFTGGMLCCSRYFLRPASVKIKCIIAAIFILVAGNMLGKLNAPDVTVNVLYSEQCAPVSLSAGPYNFLLNVGGADGLYSLEQMCLYNGVKLIDGAFVLTEKDALALCDDRNVPVAAAYVLFYDPEIIAKLKHNDIMVCEFYTGSVLDIGSGLKVANTDGGIMLYYNDFSMSVSDRSAYAVLKVTDLQGYATTSTSQITIIYADETFAGSEGLYHTSIDGQIDIEFKNKNMKLKKMH